MSTLYRGLHGSTSAIYSILQEKFIVVKTLIHHLNNVFSTIPYYVNDSVKCYHTYLSVRMLINHFTYLTIYCTLHTL